MIRVTSIKEMKLLTKLKNKIFKNNNYSDRGYNFYYSDTTDEQYEGDVEYDKKVNETFSPREEDWDSYDNDDTYDDTYDKFNSGEVGYYTPGDDRNIDHLYRFFSYSSHPLSTHLKEDADEDEQERDEYDDGA